eukprot:scaffold46740_cov65-Phaeocystis_antarctica.AAC.1
MTRHGSCSDRGKQLWQKEPLQDGQGIVPPYMSSPPHCEQTAMRGGSSPVIRWSSEWSSSARASWRCREVSA